MHAHPRPADGGPAHGYKIGDLVDGLALYRQFTDFRPMGVKRDKFLGQHCGRGGRL